MKKKKRYRIRWGRVAALLLTIAAICAGIYYAIVGIISLFTSSNDAPNSTDTEVIAVDATLLNESRRMTHRIDSLMHLPMRLDTTKIAISIFDLTTHQYIYSMHDQQLLPPASCMKIPTALAALRLLGMDHRYESSLQVRGTMRGDTLIGNLMLMADDDPLVESLDAMTSRLHRAGIRAIRGNIYLRLARVDTLRPHPSAKTWDIFYNRTPLLLKGERFIRRHLMASLHANGVAFRHDPTVKPDGRYRYVARESHALRDVITPMLIHSSNIKAESVFYHLDYKSNMVRNHRQQWVMPHAVEQYLRATFCTDSVMTIDGASISHSTHTMQGFVINDGSGLSPDNRLTASFLVDALRYAYADASLRDYLINEALATPDDGIRRGSLLSRMQQPEYRGRIFCKTGTMTTIGASSLAGYLHASNNHWLAFAIINTDSPVAESRIFQDRLCKMLMK